MDIECFNNDKNIIVIKKGKNIDFFIIDMGIAKYNKNILNNAIIYNKYIVEGFVAKKPDENNKLDNCCPSVDLADTCCCCPN